MSIPPLVCSTPPPPDQCEDDKDTEDFDLRYNLSQDEDENYDYGNYSTYDHFQSASEIKKSDVITDIVVTKNVEDEKYGDHQMNNNDVAIDLGVHVVGNRLKLDDEVIEDLDLKVDEEVLNINTVIDPCIKSESSDKTVSKSVDVIQPELDIPITTEISDDQEEIIPCKLQPDDVFREPVSTDLHQEPPSSLDEIIEDTTSFKSDDFRVTESEDFHQSEEIAVVKESDSFPTQEGDLDDDFGDFDDFQFSSTSEKPAACIIESRDPWANNNHSDDFGDFGDFKASFDDLTSNVTEAQVEDVSIVTKSSNIDVPVVDIPKSDEDDDFGDFNDFKSSAPEAAGSSVVMTDRTDSDEFSQGPVISLQMLQNESEFTESVNSLLGSIFGEEIPEPAEEFEGRLQLQLSVTWKHMLEVEERQPYMVHWNSSLAQKTLLKALCIDSRNILFGPKWSSNMPKYAATLTAAPLQPQKQVSLPSTSQTEPVTEKPASKAASTWSDPFTSEGQESCNSESGSRAAVTEPGPTDLDVFEAVIASPPDKVFSSTLNVQPIRQINLPDTHIFTPTDSETPRSKTIHYDNNPPVLLPQAIIDSKNLKSPHPSTIATASADDDDWEFHDFRGPATSTATGTQQVLERPGTKPSKSPAATYGTQLLQPIKMEPITPTLNWPEPGEVKETFDDFSDFISSTSSNVGNMQTQESPTSSSQIRVTQAEPLGSAKVTASETPLENSLDDDFDTFQSAPPSSSKDFNFASLGNNKTNDVISAVPQVAPQMAPDFEFAFPKIEAVIPSAKANKTKDAIQQLPLTFPSHQLSSSNKTTDLTPKITSPPQINSHQATGSSLLQPLPASSSNNSMQNHKSSGQILQPLSLESISQINWPNPGIDLQDLSRFNPVDTLHSLKNDLGTNSNSKGASPVHGHKSVINNQAMDDDWGEFVSSAPTHPQAAPNKQQTFVDDDEWTDFISSPSVKAPQNGVSTISLNVHTNIHKSGHATKQTQPNQLPLEIPALSIITPKSNHKMYNDRHFENL